MPPGASVSAGLPPRAPATNSPDSNTPALQATSQRRQSSRSGYTDVLRAFRAADNLAGQIKEEHLQSAPQASRDAHRPPGVAASEYVDVIQHVIELVHGDALLEAIVIIHRPGVGVEA
jgi:hypothetical protein